MSRITHMLLFLTLGSAIIFPIIATRAGLGLPSERDPLVVAQSKKECPPHFKNPDGTCRQSHRSVYRRTFFGGGIRGGK